MVALWSGTKLLYFIKAHILSWKPYFTNAGLYEEPERPANALGYIKQYMGAPNNVDVEGLKRENEDLKRQVEKLRKQLGDKA